MKKWFNSLPKDFVPQELQKSSSWTKRQERWKGSLKNNFKIYPSSAILPFVVSFCAFLFCRLSRTISQKFCISRVQSLLWGNLYLKNLGEKNG
ncbi:hypothetical protein LAU_0438 [Lausannevirus]|uniref:Uncharacterized protein n=1 Tax=Lausannevirus TaxID=999883 RepID=F2WM15_9VIRU|nr:hypothetical protein LAU_0438 [Lausannevirus]AEA07288.1 hypothetical protein LAU_0438 [Lausannevirus]